MKKISTFLVLIFIGLSLFAQKHTKHFTPKPKNKATWTKGAQFSLYLGQAGSKNWASGSDVFSLSANAFLNAYANRTNGRWFWNNSLNASYGAIHTDEYATIKSDDKIDYFSTIGINASTLKNVGFGAAVNFRSQFSDGYDRDYLNQGLKRRTSGFFAPAYITLAPLGIEWHPKHFTFYATPIAFRDVIVSNAPYSYRYAAGTIPANLINQKNPNSQEVSLASMYGVNPEKTVRFEFGAYVSAAYDAEICKNVSLMGRIDLFSDYLSHAPQNVETFWTNTFVLKVNNWLNATYSLDVAYDDNVKKFGYFKNHADWQVKSVLGVGVSLSCGYMRHRMHDGMNKMKK